MSSEFLDRHDTQADAKFYQYADRPIFVDDVLDSSSSETMSVGYYRNDAYHPAGE